MLKFFFFLEIFRILGLNMGLRYLIINLGNNLLLRPIELPDKEITFGVALVTLRPLPLMRPLPLRGLMLMLMALMALMALMPLIP